MMNNQNNILTDVRISLKAKSAIFALAFVGLTAFSCDDAKKTTETTPAETEVAATETSENVEVNNEVIAAYMELKDALVDTDGTAAAEKAKNLEAKLNSFDFAAYSEEEQAKLKPMVEAATKHTQEIAGSEIEAQREHFERLTASVMEMVEVTGTEVTLYQQFCPMYGEDGGTWLSTESNIRNPYFGDKMMTCGEVKKEIK